MTGVFYCCFLFQAEDGIRDVAVTGVQTCALPISLSSRSFPGEMWILSCSPARRQGEGRIAQTAVSLPIRGFSVTLNTVASIPEELVRMGCIMNRIARLFLIGTMAFVLVVLMPLSALASQALTRVEHPNVLVTIDPEASSQNEVTIAAFPGDRNVLVATARDTRQASGFSWAE